MDITQTQRLNHLVDIERDGAGGGAYSAGVGALWKITQDNGNGTYAAARVYDASSVGAMSRTVRPTPGETLSVGDYGIVVARGDGEWLFFCRRPQAAAISEITISETQRIRVAGTALSTWSAYIAWRWREQSGTEHACGRIYKFESAQALTDEAKLWVFAGDLWGLGGYVECTTNPSAGCTVRCDTDLYLIYESFTISGDEMSWSTFSGLSKSAALTHSSAQFTAEDYYDGSTYYITHAGAGEGDPTNPRKFCRQCTITDQTVYGIALVPGSFGLETNGGTLASANLFYDFYKSATPVGDPTDIKCYLCGV